MNTQTLPAKLATYAPLTGANLGVKCNPVNGGGATVNLASDTLAYAEPGEGYWVGGLEAPILIPAGSPAKAYTAALVAIATKWGAERFAGFWNDGEGMIYAEPVEWVRDRYTALDVARYRRELAVWDIAADAEIRLDEAVSKF